MKLSEIITVYEANGLVDTWPEGIGLWDVMETVMEYVTPFKLQRIDSIEDSPTFLFSDGVEIDGLKFCWNETADDGKLFTFFGNKEMDRWVGFLSPDDEPDVFCFFETTNELLAIIKSL